MKTDDVFVQALGGLVHLDQRLEAVFILIDVDLADSIDRLLHSRHRVLHPRRVQGPAVFKLWRRWRRRKFNIVRLLREFTRRDGMAPSRKRTGSWPRGRISEHVFRPAHAAFVVVRSRPCRRRARILRQRRREQLDILRRGAAPDRDAQRTVVRRSPSPSAHGSARPCRTSRPNRPRARRRRDRRRSAPSRPSGPE